MSRIIRQHHQHYTIASPTSSGAPTAGMISHHQRHSEPYMSNLSMSGVGGGGGGVGGLGKAAANNNSSTLTANTTIDNDMLPLHQTTNLTRWEYEEITLERSPSGLGFTVAGGTDNPHYKNDNSIYITRLIPNGPAALDGRLKLEDIIVRVDDFELSDVKHSEAVAAFKNSGQCVQLLIKRKKPFVVSSGNISSVSNNNSVGGSLFKTRQQSSNKQQSAPTNRATNNKSFATTQSNQLPPLPRSAHSGPAILRGSTQYSTTRESHSRPQTKTHLRSASFLHSKDDNINAVHTRSTSAIDLDVAKNLTRLPRTVILQRSNKGLGFNIVGGIAGSGTFISYIVPGGTAERSNKLHCGDQILSVNSIDLRQATHEEAATSLKRAGQTVKLVVKYRPEEYIKFENRINDLRERNMLNTGTLQTSQKKSLYARALFDYDPNKDSGLPSQGLSFKFGDILHIINASDDEWWQARKVLDNGQDDATHGIIPSKRRIEKRERSRLKTVKFINRNCSESMLDRRRKKFSFSKKFPFMKSRENVGNEFDENDLSGSQSNSHGILSYSSNSINQSDRGSIRNDPEDLVLSYEPVLQQNIDYARPIALYGPIKDEIECIRDELGCDDAHFYKMESIVPYTTRPPKDGEIDGVKYHFVTVQEMKRDLARHKFVEAGELNNNLYGTSIDSIREVAESGRHCLLNISPKAIKRLHEANLFPITIFMKPKSIETLLEMNKRWSYDEAAAAIEQANRLEQEYGSYFTSTIQVDSPNVLTDIMNIIAQHRGPRIWIPTTFEALNVS